MASTALSQESPERRHRNCLAQGSSDGGEQEYCYSLGLAQSLLDLYSNIQEAFPSAWHSLRPPALL